MSSADSAKRKRAASDEGSAPPGGHRQKLSGVEPHAAEEGLDAIRRAKLRAAFAAVDDNIAGCTKIGIGSGSTVVYAAQRLGQLTKEKGQVFHCVPTSFQAQQLIHDNGLTLSNLEDCPKLDLAIDGADEVDKSLNCIKGGGGCLTQEKIVAFNASKFVVVADESKIATDLGTRWKKGVPVEVVPMAYVPLQKTLEEMGGKPVLRMAKAKMGPVVTDNGNFILDVDFGALVGDKAPAKLAQTLSSIPGVVEHGLFVGMAASAYFGMADGTVELQHAQA